MPNPTYHNDFGGPLGPEWELYHSPGHAGWGLRRPSAISIVADPEAGNGSALRITARMGTAANEGLLVSGGLKLTGHGQTYGTYTVRVRTEPDPHEATSAVALLWPTSNRWPEGGEINIFETWGSRATRSPVESHLHWPTGSDDTFTSIDHPTDGTIWHTYTLEWRPELVAVSVDGAAPRVLTRDPATIPHHNMDPTFQLDAFDSPSRPGAQPVIDGSVSFFVDSLTIEP